MAKIKNMGTATMKFGEGVIVEGTAGTDVHALVVTGSTQLEGDLTVGGNDLVVGEFTGQADLYLNAGSLGSRLFLRGTGDAMSAGDNIGAVYFDATENDGVTISTAGWMIAEPTSATYTVGSDMPTRIKFGVCRDGQSSPTDTLYIDGSSTVTRVGILNSSPSYTLDVSGDIRVTDDLFVDDFARIDALRVGITSTDPGDGNLFVEGDATIDSNLTVNSNILDNAGKSFIKHINHGGFLASNANTTAVYLPEDSLTEPISTQYYTSFVAPYSGSIDKVIFRSGNGSDLADLGDLTVSVKIGNDGKDSYNIDTTPNTFENVTVVAANLGANTNVTFNFSTSNLNPSDVYAISVTPTNNWDNNGTKYITYTIVSSYLLD